MRRLAAIGLLLLCLSGQAHGFTYWVSPSGGASTCAAVRSDSDPGTYLTRAQMQSLACAGPADTTMHKGGTYTGTNIRYELIQPKGTSALAMSKVLCEGDRTCVLAFSNQEIRFGGVVRLQNVDHYVFGQEGHAFSITCVNAGAECTAFNLHISDNLIHTNIQIEGNEFQSVDGENVAMKETQPVSYYTNVRFRKNKFNNQTGPIATDNGQAHGVYLTGTDHLFEQNDVTNSWGYGIQCYHIARNIIIRSNMVRISVGRTGLTCQDSEAAQPTNNQIYSNAFRSTDGTGQCIYLRGASGPAKVYNNTCINFPTQLKVWSGAGTASEYKNNVCSGACSIVFDPGVSVVCGGTCSTINPTVTAASHFKNVGADDYSLIAGSSLINAGLDVSAVRPCNGACDIGAHETFAPTAASIDTNFMDVTLGMSLSTPPQFTSGVTGWSVNCSGTGCGTPTVSAVSLLTGSNSVARLTIGGITGGVCAAGQTWTWSFNSTTGTVTDSAKIGNAGNQRFFTYSTQSATNSCGSSSPPSPGSPWIYYKLDDGTSGTTPTSANDESANNLDGTLTGGATWTAGRYGSGVQLTPSSGQYIAVPYGNGINPSTQSLTIAFGVNVTPGQEGLNKSYFGSDGGTSQRLQITTRNGSWCLGIQASGESLCDTALSVQPGWNRIFITLNSATDTATLCRNGSIGTGQDATKAYTSYTLASNFQLGRIANVATGGGGVFDEFKVWTSVESCEDDFLAWEPPSPPATGTFAQVGHQFGKVRPASGNTWETYGLLNGRVEVIRGGAVSLVTQLDCTVAECESIGIKLWYSKDGFLTAQPVPDLFTSDQVAFYGQTNDHDIFLGAATCCLSGALTANHGTTRVTETAEVFDIGLNQSYTSRSIIKLGDAASGTYCFQERDQNGNVLNGTYTPIGGACVEVVPPQAGAGF